MLLKNLVCETNTNLTCNMAKVPDTTRARSNRRKKPSVKVRDNREELDKAMERSNCQKSKYVMS